MNKRITITWWNLLVTKFGEKNVEDEIADLAPLF